jgi:hypothetical protein
VDLVVLVAGEEKVDLAVVDQVHNQHQLFMGLLLVMEQMVELPHLGIQMLVAEVAVEVPAVVVQQHLLAKRAMVDQAFKSK